MPILYKKQNPYTAATPAPEDDRTGMMKARLAYANEFDNSTARRFSYCE